MVRRHIFVTSLDPLFGLLLRYSGVDWIVTCAGFTSLYLLGNKCRTGFLFGTIAAAFGILFSYQIGSIANGISSTAFLVLNIRGYLKWREV